MSEEKKQKFLKSLQVRGLSKGTKYIVVLDGEPVAGGEV
jgi:hypothetical protein